MSLLYENYPRSTTILIALSIILFSGFLVTRVTKRLHLPNVSGFILAGMLIGPHAIGLIPEPLVDKMGFVSDIALAFIAFNVGKFFRKKTLKRTGCSVFLVTLLESLLAGLLVFAAMYFLFHLSAAFSLLLGAIATATAPASTMMTISQYRAKGPFVDTLLQVVALDDVVCLLAFSVTAAIVNGQEGGFSAADLVLPLVWNVLAIGLGFLCGFLLSRLLRPATRSQDNRLILAVAMLLGLSGVCALFDISPLLSCMVFGAAYMNLTRDKALFRQLSGFTPPVMSMFFIISGMNLDVRLLGTVGLIGICYFFIRILGKYGGAWLGAKLSHMDGNIRNYLGLALIPQAGVAIGLAFLGDRMLPPAIGDLLLTIILSSSVLYELIGPACAKLSLTLSGAITPEAIERHKAGKQPADNTRYKRQ
ncbi:cation:proton antiporter [Agathobaculum sp.]|uniref:cation:proton antiporter n=1 Tax=Agathobaculum sp. TaxID=2048138 RepID=UPI002A805B7D|nr:cation:proton antiporter [Agathobaculum sp.]MDY3619338.1 cation:proton antiporter [Agathobaculum sp.]